MHCYLIALPPLVFEYVIVNTEGCVMDLPVQVEASTSYLLCLDIATNANNVNLDVLIYLLFAMGDGGWEKKISYWYSLTFPTGNRTRGSGLIEKSANH